MPASFFHVGISSGLTLPRSCKCSHNLSEFMYATELLGLESTASLKHLSAALPHAIVLPPLLQWLPILGVYLYIPLRAEPSTALILYTLTCWGAYVNRHWERHWYIERSEKSLGVIWILDPFSRIIVLGHRAYGIGRPRLLALITVPCMTSISCNEPKTQS